MQNQFCICEPLIKTIKGHIVCKSLQTNFTNKQTLWRSDFTQGFDLGFYVLIVLG